MPLLCHTDMRIFYGMLCINRSFWMIFIWNFWELLMVLFLSCVCLLFDLFHFWVIFGSLCHFMGILGYMLSLLSGSCWECQAKIENIVNFLLLLDLIWGKFCEVQAVLSSLMKTISITSNVMSEFISTALIARTKIFYQTTFSKSAPIDTYIISHLIPSK